MTRPVTLSIAAFWCGLVSFVAIAAAEPAPAPSSNRVDAQGDPLPNDAVARLGTTRFRHGAPVTLIEASGDGKYLLTGSKDGVVRIWDAQTGKLLRSWGVNVGPPIASLSPDGKQIAASLGIELTYSTDPKKNPPGAVHIGANLESLLVNGKPPSANNFRSFIALDIAQIAWTSDGKHFATLDPTNIVRVYNVDRNTTQPTKYSDVSAFCFTPDGTTVILARKNGELSFQRFPEEKPSKIIRDNTLKLPCVGLFPLVDGTVGSIDESGRVTIWDFKQGKSLGQFKAGHPFAATAKTNDLVAVHEGTLTLYDAVKGEKIRSIAQVGEVQVLALAPGGNRCYVGGPGDSFRIWDLTTGKEERSQSGHRSEITGLAVSSDGKTLFSTSAEGLCLWDLARNVELAADRRPALATALALAPDNRRMVIGSAKGLQVWEPVRLDTSKPIADKAFLKIDSTSDRIAVLAYAPDGRQIAFADDRKRIVFADPSRGTTTGSISFEAEPIAVNYARSTRHLAVLTRDGQLHLCSIDAQPKEVWKKRVQRARKGAVVFSPDGLLVATSSAGRVSLLETVTGRMWHGFDRQLGDGDVHALAFSPDGQLLIAGHGGPHGILRLWEVLSGKEITTFRGHVGGVAVVAFTPDGRKIISGSTDSTILVWDVTLSSGTGEKSMDPRNAWDLLDSDDTKAAYRAMGGLIRAGREAVPVLKQGMQKALADQAQYAEWIRQLDSDEFKKRKAARTSLEKAGWRAMPSLSEALTKNLKPEPERLVQLILEGFDQKGLRMPSEGLFGEPLRTVRTIHVLEHLGGKEAMEVLESLAESKEESRVKTEATAALRRMKR